MSNHIYTLPRSQAEAIQAGVSFYFTGKPCKHGHTTKRDLRYHCVECENNLRNTPDQKKKRLDVSRSWHEQNKNRESLKASRRRRSKRWRELHPEQRRLEHLQRNYGMTLQEYEHLLTKQGHKCALCKKTFAADVSARNALAPVIDHDHDTGEVRGIVHSNCNKLLGFADDDKRKLQLAIQYLS